MIRSHTCLRQPNWLKSQTRTNRFARSDKDIANKLLVLGKCSTGAHLKHIDVNYIFIYNHCYNVKFVFGNNKKKRT